MAILFAVVREYENGSHGVEFDLFSTLEGAERARNKSEEELRQRFCSPDNSDIEQACEESSIFVVKEVEVKE